MRGPPLGPNKDFIYDSNSRLDNPTFLDYRMPVTSDMPMIKAIIIEVPTEKHPRGVRGVGEVPIVPPMARLRMPFAPPQVCA